jgi:hypothetical protein
MTYQTHEKLILNGESVFMENFPDIPKDHPRITQGSCTSFIPSR